jgi:hypothetical protein
LSAANPGIRVEADTGGSFVWEIERAKKSLKPRSFKLFLEAKDDGFA